DIMIGELRRRYRQLDDSLSQCRRLETTDNLAGAIRLTARHLRNARREIVKVLGHPHRNRRGCCGEPLSADELGRQPGNAQEMTGLVWIAKRRRREQKQKASDGCKNKESRCRFHELI